MKIEVECQTEEEADEAIAAGADIIMLDNFKGVKLFESAAAVKKRWDGKARFLIEGSGGITEETALEYFSPGAE